MVKRLKKMFKAKRVELEVGSETGLERELSRPGAVIEAKKKGKSLALFGLRITFRWR